MRIASATASGSETMTTCEPSSSVIVAPARSAIDLVRSVPAALSPVATTAQDGNDFHAGGPEASEKPASAIGRCVAAITAAWWAGRSAANASWNLAGSTTNSVAVAPPSGYFCGTSAGPRIASFDVGVTSPSSSPSSGANAQTKTRPTTLSASLAAFEITAPPYECPTARTGPGI